MLRLVLSGVAATLAVVPLSTQEPVAARLDESAAGALDWRPLGPANMGGRIVDLAVVASNPTTFYVATASGGLLKTVNNGITFEHQFDKETTVAIGAVAVSQSNPDVVWVGTGEENPRNSVSYGDGVYKSTDGGKTWKNMGLHESFQIGSIVVHPTDPDVVYVGALGRLYGPNEERGLYKTTDGGERWTKIHFVDQHTGVIDIDMHPEHPDTLIFATYERERDGFDTNDPAKKLGPGSGLWRTTDGGKTFEKLTEGLPTCTLGRICVDWFAKDPDVLYALVESERIGMVGDDVGFAGFEAEDAETGARVTGVTKDGPAAKAGLKEGDIVLRVGEQTVLSDRAMQEALAQHGPGTTVRLEVAREGEPASIDLQLTERPKPVEGDDEAGPGAPARQAGGRPGGRTGGRSANPTHPFRTRLGGQSANIQRLQGKNGHEFGGLYRSEDGGETWTRVNSINPRPMYFSHVRVDPSDRDRIYVLGISAARSSDGGATFTSDASRGVHSDQHALWIDPRDGRHMIIGSDGGLYVTYDRCENWDHLNHAALGQFYHATVGPRRDYWVYGGLQDNGTWGAPHRALRGGGPVNEDWLRVGGGDGFLVAVDPDDPEQLYYESQNGGMGRTHLGTMESGRIRPEAPRGVRYRFNWRTPFLLSSHNGRIYYCAGNHVFRSLNKGDDLKAISPEITLTDRGSATALAESPIDADVLYVGTDDGALWGTKDGGKAWQDLLAWAEDIGEPIGEVDSGTRGGPRVDDLADTHPLRELIPGPRWVASLEASRFEKGRVYLALDGHRSDDDAPHVFVSEDFGATWQSIVANLPRGSTRVLREDLKNPNVLYLGTEFGFWVSTDRGGSWIRFHGDELPTVAVHEVAQHRSSGEVVLATHGRSLWAADVTVLRQMTADALKGDAHLFRPNDAVLWETRHRRASTGGARAFAGENPDVAAQVFVRLGKDAQSVRLSVRNAAGGVLRELEVPKTAGLHRVDWDLRGRTEDAGDDNDPRSRWRSRFAPRVDAGTYHVVLEVDGTTQERAFRVRPDPNEASGR